MAIPIIEMLIPLADAHRELDEYIAGTYWNGRRGCAVGCAINDLKMHGVLNGVNHDDHDALSTATGVPEMLWRLCDHIFEGLLKKDRPRWPGRHLRAFAAAQNLESVPSRVMARFADKLADDAVRVDVRENCRHVAGLWRRRAAGDDPSKTEWKAARERAYAAWQQVYALFGNRPWPEWWQADAALRQVRTALRQGEVALRQIDSATKQACATRGHFWEWCADMLCEECERS